MPKVAKLYVGDALVNTIAQAAVLFAGCLSLLWSGIAVLIWIPLAVGYAFVLAGMARKAVQRGAVFGRYVLFVMLPPNALAIAVSIRLLTLGASSSALVGNIPMGIAVLAGSAAISLMAALFNRVCLSKG